MTPSPTRKALAATAAFLLLLLPMACTNDAPPMGDKVVGRDSLPVMVTRGVSKLITDSGVIRYKIITEEWRVYDKTNPPRWEFPKGLFLERYDNQFRVDMRFSADSAWLYDQRKWKLRGHVVLDDLSGDTHVRTEELFWDMQTGELASNVYTYLKQPQQAIEGTWFRATLRDGQPTHYHVKQAKGFMPMGSIAAGGGAPLAAPIDSATTEEKEDSTAKKAK